MLMDKDKYCHKFDLIILFSKTFHHDSKWQNLNIHPSLVFDTFDDQFVMDLILDLEKLSTKVNIKSLFIFDDMIDQNIMNPQKMGALETIAVRARHFGTSIIIISQQYMKLSPPIRNNCTNGIFYRIRNNKERKVIREENQEMMGKKDFDKLLDFATREPYSFLHINNQVANPAHRFRRNWDEVLYLNNVEKLAEDSDSDSDED
jgi:hypothetical protein